VSPLKTRKIVIPTLKSDLLAADDGQLRLRVAAENAENLRRGAALAEEEGSTG
jgi:hypothetical protein